MVHQATTNCPLSLLLNAVMHDAIRSDANEVLLRSEAKQIHVLYRVGNELREQFCLRRFVSQGLTEHLRNRMCAQAERETDPATKAFLLRWCKDNDAVHVSYAVA